MGVRRPVRGRSTPSRRCPDPRRRGLAVGLGPFLDGLRGFGSGTLFAAIAIGALTTVRPVWRWRVVAATLAGRPAVARCDRRLALPVGAVLAVAPPAIAGAASTGIRVLASASLGVATVATVAWALFLALLGPIAHTARDECVDPAVGACVKEWLTTREPCTRRSRAVSSTCSLTSQEPWRAAWRAATGRLRSPSPDSWTGSRATAGWADGG